MPESPARTPLYDWHVAHHARMVEFGGWSMPVQYTSIVDEHQATRRTATLFDISHMGRLRFDGPGGAAFLDGLLTRRVVGMEPGKIRYSLMTNEAGGILDDVLVYHLSDEKTPSYHVLVVNAGNREKIVSWIRGHESAARDVRWVDQTLDTAMIAVQGPQAIASAQSLTAVSIRDLDYYTGCAGPIAGTTGIISRTGYTGEDGCELIVPRAAALPIWESLLSAGRESGVMPAGLGARDTLRLEAAMPLYGHELNEAINPYQAGLSFAVNLKHEFIGRERLERLKNAPDQPVRIGLELAGKRVPREHYAVVRAGQPVGEVTSGTFSPSLERPIAMAYVRPDAAEVGTELAIDIRGKHEPAKVVPLPFYRRKD